MKAIIISLIVLAFILSNEVISLCIFGSLFISATCKLFSAVVDYEK